MKRMRAENGLVAIRALMRDTDNSRQCHSFPARGSFGGELTRVVRGRLASTLALPKLFARVSIACLAFVALFALPLSCAAAGAQNANGFYVYMRHPSLERWEAVYDDALAADYVDGAALVIEWNLIEPKPDVYDWTHLDRWIEKVMAAGKKLSIGVTAGMFAPEWLYDIGVPKNSFRFNRNNRGIACSLLSQPSPWDPTYLKEYGKMIDALAAHLRGLSVAGQPPAAAWNALQVVKLSGINVSTEELRLPANAPDDGPCEQSDAVTIWAKAGFLPEKIVSAWMKIAAATERAFPGKLLSVGIIPRGAFPPIDDAGEIYARAKKDPDRLTARIVDKAVDIYGGRLLVTWNALSQLRKLPQEVLDAGSRGAKIGWQMNNFLGLMEGSGCIYKPFTIKPCESLQDFQAILENGISNGGGYIEVHAPSVNATNGPAFREVHDRLLEVP